MVRKSCAYVLSWELVEEFLEASTRSILLRSLSAIVLKGDAVKFKLDTLTGFELTSFAYFP